MKAESGSRLRLMLASFWLPIILFAIFSLGLLGIGFAVFSYEKDAVRKSTEENLLAVVRGKSAAVANWVFERRADAKSLAGGLGASATLEQWLADGSPADARRRAILRRLSSVDVYRNYAGATFTDLQGKVIIDTNDQGPTGDLGPAGDPATAALAREAASSGEVQLGPPHRTAGGTGPIVMYVATPVVSAENDRTVGVLVLTVNPVLQLYPMVEQWPGKSASGEANIVVANGDSVLFVTKPRHSNALPLTLSIPASPDTLYGRAVHDKEGVAEGLDYGGTPVLDASTAIFATPWHLVAQIDTSEVYAPVRGEAMVIGISVCVLVAATGFLLLAAWNRQQISLLSRQYQDELAKRDLELRLQERSRAADDARAQLAAVVESSRSGIIAVDLEGIVTAWNEGATKIYGYSAEEMIGQPISIVGSPEPRARVLDRLEGIAHGLEPTTREVVRIRKDGRQIDVLQTFSPIKDPDGKLVGASSIVLDISERKQTERTLQKTGRALRTLSRGNEALVRATSSQELFEEMCRVIVDVGEYRMAWVGIAEHDAAKSVRVAASAGHVDGYFAHVRVTWDDSIPGQGPTGMAIKTGQAQINQNFESNAAVAPWWPEAHKRGYRASIALPIREADQVIGALIIYATEPDAFGPEETRLLRELADDVSFGLAALRARTFEQLLSSAIDNISDAISIFDTGDRVVWTNKRYNDLFALSAKEIHGKTFEELVRTAVAKGQYPAATVRAEEYVRERLAAHRDPGRLILNYMNVDGGMWIQGRDDRMPDGHTIAVRTNVTSLVEAEERLKSLADNLPGIIFRWAVQPNGELREIYISEGVERMLGVKPEEFTAGTAKLTDFLHPDDREKHAARIGDAIAKLAPLAIPGERFVSRKGSARWWQINASPRRLPNGNIQFDGIALDITEQRRAEDQLRRAQRLDSLGQLTSGISHDFNNLLSAIIGSLELAMERSEGNPKLHDVIKNATDAAFRGAELTKRLLAFSRGQPLSPEVVDLNQRLSGMRRLLDQALNRSIKMSLQPGEGLWRCLVDPTQVDDAVLNLCINARDAMPDGGQLTVTTANIRLETAATHALGQVELGEYVCLSVADTGHGMPREVLDQVFEPFFTTKGTEKGTGLGLAQVYGFVKQSNGQVAIDTEVGRGTTVYIYLPRVGRTPA